MLSKTVPLLLTFTFVLIPFYSWAQNETDKAANEQYELRRRWNIEETNDVIYALQNNLAMPYFVEKEEWDKTIDRYDLRGIDLSNSELNKADLSHASLMYASFERSDLEEADLSDTDLTGVNLTLANLWKADLAEAILTNAVLEDAVLDEADLRSSDMSGTVFAGARLKNANLSHSNMTGAYLTGGDFTDADLSYVNLRGAHLYGALLSGAGLVGADLTGAVLEPEQIWDIDFKGARNMSRIIWGNELSPSPYIINQELDGRYEDALIRYRDLKNLYREHFQSEMVDEFHYRENVVKTKLSPEPLRLLRKVFLEWTYGYGSRPLRLIPFCLGVILVFGLIYTIQTLLPGRSGIYLVSKGEESPKTFHVMESRDAGQGLKSYILEEEESGGAAPGILKFERGALIINCLYFSLLSFATFGYGALKPRQWLEFFRLTPVQYRPVRWSRIFVGFEAAIGIYLLALTAIVIFK